MADTFLVIGTGPTVNIVLSGAGTPYTAGAGIAISGANVISNTAPDQTVTMTDGTGIDVTGTYPNFTVTNTSPNVVQTLSIAGQDLTLSGGGGTVAIPGGASDALGTGFTSGGGSGTIGAAANATITDYFNIRFPSGTTAFYLDGNTGSIAVVSSDEIAQMNFGNLGLNISAFDKSISIDENGAYFRNDADGLGWQYLSDYSATIITNRFSNTVGSAWYASLPPCSIPATAYEIHTARLPSPLNR